MGRAALPLQKFRWCLWSWLRPRYPPLRTPPITRLDPTTPCSEGNHWSYQYCRRQWSLADSGHLRYSQLQAWDRACLSLDDVAPYIASTWQWATMMDDERQVSA